MSRRRGAPGAWLRRAVRRCLDHPRAVLALWAALLAASAFGARELRIDTSTDGVLDRGDPAWQFYQRSLETFGGDEILVVALEGPRAFDPVVLGAVVALGDALAALPGVRRVDSLASVPLIRASAAGDLDLSPALAAGVPRAAAGRLALAQRVGRDRIAPGSLVSRDGRVAALNVLLERDLGPRTEGVVTGVRRTVDRSLAGLEGVAHWISGVPVFRTEINTRTGSEIAFFSALTALLVGGFLRAAFGSWRAAALPLAVGAVGSGVVAGAMGALAIPLTLSTMILPSILLALGCAYSLHLVAAAGGASGAAALERALAPVLAPVALSGLTTALGFASIAAVRIDAIRQVGGCGALGAAVTAAAALSLGPAALRLWPLPPARAAWRDGLLGPLRATLLGLVRRRRAALLAGSAVLALLAGAGLARLELETDATRWFRPGSPVRASYERIRERLAGISPMNVVVEGREGAPVTRPDALAALHGLARHLAARPEVGRALSMADPLLQLHEGFTGARELALPDSRPLIEQYLLLLDSVDRMRDLVSADRRAANVALRVDDNGSGRLMALAAEAERWWRERGPAELTARATGIMYEFARAEDEIARGQLRGLALALGCVALLFLAVYRSPRVAAFALLPNALPIGVAFGAMGLAGVPLDAGTVLVGGLALGIAVDDTVHLTGAYQRARRAGRAPLAALDAAFGRVLVPLVSTTVALAAGFAVLGLSAFSFTRNLGLLTSAILVLCLLADVLLLPALLIGRVRQAAGDAAAHSGAATQPVSSGLRRRPISSECRSDDATTSRTRPTGTRSVASASPSSFGRPASSS